jgi:hypothetical protein
VSNQLPLAPASTGPTGAPDGLYRKFNVSRVDGKDRPGGPKQGAWYFVLDCFNDPYARPAALAYAAACESELPHLAADIRATLAEWEPVQP